MMNPGLTRVEMRVAPPGTLGTDEDRGYVIYHTHAPIDRGNLEWRWIFNTRAKDRWADDPSKSVAEGIAQTMPKVVEEDRWALEKQQKMFAYADDGYHEVPLKRTGRCSPSASCSMPWRPPTKAAGPAATWRVWSPCRAPVTPTAGAGRERAAAAQAAAGPATRP